MCLTPDSLLLIIELLAPKVFKEENEFIDLEKSNRKKVVRGDNEVKIELLKWYFKNIMISGKKLSFTLLC